MITLYKILWIIGAMSGALCLGLILLQFAIWIWLGLSEEEQNRPLFNNFEGLTWETFYPYGKHIARHKQIRLELGDYHQQAIERAERNIDRIIKEMLDKKTRVYDV